MRGRRFFTLLAIVLTAVAGAQAQTNASPEATVDVVEGHSVWVELAPHSEYSTEFADPTRLLTAADGGLEVESGDGVHWFDDSYIHRIDTGRFAPGMGAVAVHVANRGFSVCGGAVWATNAGAPLLPLGEPVADYQVSDPFGFIWTTVVYSTSGDLTDPSALKWGVRLLEVPNVDGTGCYVEDSTTYYGPDGTAWTMNVPYNALLWMPMGFEERPLAYGQPVEFGSGGADQGATTHRGNSHAHNPLQQGNHGPVHGHTTVSLDLYYATEEPEPSGSVVFASNPDFANYHHH